MLTHYLTRIWFKKGKHPEKRFVFDHRSRIYAMGALSFDEVITEITPSVCAQAFERFLRGIQEKYQKVVFIMDNVRVHFTRPLRLFYRNKNVRIIRFPKYSPQLNPIEMYWRIVKQWIANKEFFTKSQLRKVVDEAFKTPFLMPNISGYQVT